MDRDDRRSGERDEHVGASAGQRTAGNAGGTSGLAYAGLGFQFAASLVALYYLGSWIDRRLGTTPVAVLACVLVGSAAAFYVMYRQLMGAQRREAVARAAARARDAGDTATRDAGPGTPESRP